MFNSKKDLMVTLAALTKRLDETQQSIEQLRTLMTDNDKLVRELGAEVIKLKSDLSELQEQVDRLKATKLDRATSARTTTTTKKAT